MEDLHARRSGQRGNAIIEFAIAWSILSLLFIGVYQYGYTFYQYNALMTRVAGAAELGSQMPYDQSNTAAYSTALQNFVVYGQTTAGTTPVVKGLSTSNVNVAVTLSGTSPNQIPTDLTITITGYQVPSIFQTFTFNGKPRATTAYMGNVICSGC